MLLHCWLIYNNAATSFKRTSSSWKQEYPVNLESNVYVLSSVELSYYALCWLVPEPCWDTEGIFSSPNTLRLNNLHSTHTNKTKERSRQNIIVFSLVLTKKQYKAQHPNCTSLSTNTMTSKQYLSWQCENLDTTVCAYAEVAIVAAFVLTLTSQPGQRQPYRLNARSPAWLLLLPYPG